MWLKNHMIIRKGLKSCQPSPSEEASYVFFILYTFPKNNALPVLTGLQHVLARGCPRKALWVT